MWQSSGCKRGWCGPDSEDATPVGAEDIQPLQHHVPTPVQNYFCWTHIISHWDRCLPSPSTTSCHGAPSSLPSRGVPCTSSQPHRRSNGQMRIPRWVRPPLLATVLLRLLARPRTCQCPAAPPVAVGQGEVPCLPKGHSIIYAEYFPPRLEMSVHLFAFMIGIGNYSFCVRKCTCVCEF